MQWWKWGLIGALGVILFSLALPSIHLGADNSKEALNNAMLGQLKGAMEAYKIDFGEYPEGQNRAIYRALTGGNPRAIAYIELNPKIASSNQELNDPWHTPYQMTSDRKEGVTIRSAGRDKKFGTDDDSVLNVP